jgi:hypothetical protein
MFLQCTNVIVAYVQAVGIPIALPDTWSQYVLEKQKMLFSLLFQELLRSG